MNERIQKLAEQVGAVQNVLAMGRHDGVLFTETELEKFAEFIIQECAITVIDRCEMRNADDVRRAEYHAKRIKQHFGVEE